MVLFGEPITDIALIAVIIAVVLFILQKVVGGKKLKENQKKMKEKQKQIKELNKKGDEKSKQKAMELQKEMLAEMPQMLSGSMKTMIISMVIVLPTLWWLQSVYAGQQIVLPIALPIFGTETSWFWWYVIVGIIAAVILNIGGSIVNKIKEKKEIKVEPKEEKKEKPVVEDNENETKIESE